MKLKCLLTYCILALFFSNIANGEELDSTQSKKKLFEHQIGIDATIFIQNFTFNGGGFIGSPYTLNYKLLYNFKKGFIQSAGLRAGFGYFRQESSSENIIQGNSSSNKNIRWDYRFGLEAQKRISKHWVVYLGFDYVIEEEDNGFRNTFKSGNNFFTTESNTKIKSEGFGPVVGMQFNFNKYISLGTEMSMYGMKGNTESITQSGTNIPQITKGSFNTTQLIPPAFINFIVRF